jgi:Cof subfamily protein (haloacid dehalogenase superfamily)
MISYIQVLGEIMAYRLAAVDLDDTLLTSERRINQRSKESLLKAARSGVTVVLCTGRTKKGAQRFYDDLGLDTLLITTGGAQVFDGDDAVYTKNVDPETAKKLLIYAYDNGIYANVYMDGELVYKERNGFTDLYEKRYGHVGIMVPDLLERDIVTPKVLLFIAPEKMPYVQAAVKKEFPMLSAVRSHSSYLEFSDPEVSKGAALGFVAERYGIKRNEIIAFGDTEIDVSMLEFAGLGVAVENADPAAKQAADIICASNDDGGIADVIEKYILEEQSENKA